MFSAAAHSVLDGTEGGGGEGVYHVPGGQPGPQGHTTAAHDHSPGRGEGERGEREGRKVGVERG